MGPVIGVVLILAIALLTRRLVALVGGRALARAESAQAAVTENQRTPAQMKARPRAVWRLERRVGGTMPRIGDRAGIDALHADWCRATAAAPRRAALDVLADLLAARGTSIAPSELRFAFADVADPAALGRDGFRAHAVPVLADESLRRQEAFSYLAGGAAAMTVATLAERLAALDVPEAGALVAELDRDGDGQVSVADIEHALAMAPPPAYRATHVEAARLGALPPATATGARPASPAPARPAEGGGLSAMHLQTGFFRLVQGAAYRSFRESYSAHSETHLRARDLPYTIRDFRRFVEAAVRFYTCLGVVEGEAALAEFAALAGSVDTACAELDARIADWPEVAVTPEMAAAEAAIAEARAAEADHRRHLGAALEMALVMRLHGVAPDRMHPELLTRHELNRLRHRELAAEHHSAPTTCGTGPDDWLAAWTAVLTDGDGSRQDGAIMPVRFWYETFMPRLLRCASIRSDSDLAALEAEGEAALAAWHAQTAQSGAFDRYAADLRDGFAACPLPVKRALKQAWRLTAPYLEGIEKRRERAEFGRDSGALSQYVAFVDAYLGRTDVRDAQMRVSFPYYIGPAVWGFLHGAAEIVEGMPAPRRAEAIAAFKAFFRAFATMYPCPYCRYHLNRFVVGNGETAFYPVEFLFLGQRADRAPLDIGLDDRLATISADRPGSLRLFVWKLHNAVSSSIARTEAWYHREEDAFYTTRHWPGFEAELARVRAHGHQSLSVERVAALYAIAKPVAHLATLRDEVVHALDAGDAEAVARLAGAAAPRIAALEAALEETGVLTESYRLDPDRGESAPVAVTESEVAFARSGLFTER